ncbi:hypothetical protein QAD02_007010 [Eretmocerus hayati]|uniref:Uncharacterized protein n=1 Tax=Eretmocerus hayati TaxID=131215 RepID=A0ACC2N2H7_9HYME|nr:hypothetical protein QAD02_007010 [Eretmocerus hayati]
MAQNKGKKHSSNSYLEILVIVVASMCFLVTHNGDFVFDDSEAIVNNQDTQMAPLHQIFQNDFWGTKLSSKYSHKSYRPLTILSFRWNYILRGKLNPPDFHKVNILLHMIVSVMTLFIFNILLNRKCPIISFHAALLFSVHPIHSEAVAGIVGRADVLCSLFMWLSLFSYHKSVTSRSSMVQWSYLFLSITSSSISMLCKEIGITVLGICIIYDVLMVNKILPKHLLSFLKPKYTCQEMKRLMETKYQCFTRCMVLIVASLLLLWTRFKIMGFSKPEFKSIDNPASLLDNTVLRIINYHYIYALNMWLLLCPLWLCFDWSMGCIPLILEADMRIILVLIMWLFFGALMMIIFSDSDPQLVRFTTMGVALMLLPFLPASNLFFPVGFVIAERVLYVPSAGFCLLVAIGLNRVIASVKYPKAVLASFYVLIIVFFARSWTRSNQWNTESSLFQSGLNVCPLNAKVHYNIGKNAADKGNKDHAKIEYQEAIRLNPNYSQAMNNLGNLYKDEKNYDMAEKLFRQAITLQNDFAAAWMNLGIVLSAMKRYTEAEMSYSSAIAHRNMYPDCYYNLGLLHLATKQHESALKNWKIATQQKPHHRQAWTNMVILFENLGMKVEALNAARQALRFIPNDPSIHFNIGNILGKDGDFQQAELHFKTAISANPNNSIYHTNLGVLYHRWNRYEDAEVMYRKALQLNPSSSIARGNLKKLKILKL